MTKKYKQEEMADMLENYLWRKCKCNAKDVAEMLGCSQDMAYKMMRGERAPNKKALELLGFKKVKQTWFERL